MLRALSDPSPVLVALVGLSIVAAGLVVLNLLLAMKDARDTMPFSEWEARELRRDQYRAERRRKLRALQVRLGLRKAS